MVAIAHPNIAHEEEVLRWKALELCIRWLKVRVEAGSSGRGAVNQRPVDSYWGCFRYQLRLLGHPVGPQAADRRHSEAQ